MAEQLQFLGKVIPESSHVDRDAFHVAVIPCIGGITGRHYEHLGAGDLVKLAFGTTNTVIRADYDEADAVGIIDPFIDSGVNLVGKRFYVWLLPGTVTGMRHHWQHPAFDVEKKSTNEAELWLRRFAEKWNFDYDEMIAVATNPDCQDEYGYPLDYITARGVDLHSASELEGDDIEFWHHIETLTGKKFDDDHREKVGWSCSC